MNGINSKRNSLSSHNGSRGFSLFELVAFILVSAILYSVAVNRFSEYPAAAERANFQAVLTQIQTGVSLETMLGLLAGNARPMQDYMGLNPMDLLLKAPSNYLGAFDALDESSQPRRSWYFDKGSKELVYLINADENAYLVQNSVATPTREIRFGIVMTYQDPVSLRTVTYAELQALKIERGEGSDAAEGEAQGINARTSGVVLRPIIPYRWEMSEEFAAEFINAS